MGVVQGWSGRHFLTKTIYISESQNSHSISVYSSFMIAHFTIVLASYLCQQHKMFYSDCVASSGDSIWLSSSEVWNFCLPRCIFIGPNNENHWGLSLGCKEGGSWFLSPLLAKSPLSNMLYVDEHCLAVGWFPLTVYQVVSSDHLMCITV